MTDLTRNNENFQKKQVSVLVAPLIVGPDTANGQISAVTANHLLAKLPADAYVTNAFVFTEEVSDAATSAVLTLGTASGGAQIMTGGNLKTLGKTGTLATTLNTSTGIEVWANLTYTGATTEVGAHRVIVEYIEHTLNTGAYTQFN